MHHGWMPSWVKTASAVALLAVLAAGAFYRPRGAAAAGRAGGETVRLGISGMTCSHCASAITRALLECPGVASAEVSLSAALAEVAGDGLDRPGLLRAVEQLGYGAQVVSDAPGKRPGGSPETAGVS
jgi:copper chaperone CopZ